MKTLYIKTASGRIVEVNKEHGEYLVAKKGASVVEKPKPTPKKIVEEKIKEEK